MDTATHPHEHHEMPTAGGALTVVALSATLHCLTGCAIGDVLFWGALSVALVVAGAFALPLNRWLIARGRGHAVVHETGVHGGPSPRVVGAIAVVAFVFGVIVLAGEFLHPQSS